MATKKKSSKGKTKAKKSTAKKSTNAARKRNPSPRPFTAAGYAENLDKAIRDYVIATASGDLNETKGRRLIGELRTRASAAQAHGASDQELALAQELIADFDEWANYKPKGGKDPEHRITPHPAIAFSKDAALWLLNGDIKDYAAVVRVLSGMDPENAWNDYRDIGYSRSRPFELLQFLNQITDLHGWEGITAQHPGNGDDLDVSYLNTGESYGPTLVMNNNRFSGLDVSSWADEMEAWERGVEEEGWTRSEYDGTWENTADYDEDGNAGDDDDREDNPSAIKRRLLK